AVDRSVDARGTRPREPGRRLQHERNADLLLVRNAVVVAQAVLEELLAVVGGEEDGGVVEQTALVEGAEEAAELLVDVAQVAVVERFEALDADVRGPLFRGALERLVREVRRARAAIPLLVVLAVMDAVELAVEGRRRPVGTVRVHEVEVE